MKKLFLCSVFCLLSACSSIINSTSQEISFSGNVNKIKIKQNGMLLCQTPCSVVINRDKNGALIMAEKDGYESVPLRLNTKLSVFFWGNIIFGGLLGSTTDALSGGMWEYAPSQFYIDMTEDGKTANKKLQDVKKFVLKNYTALKAETAEGKTGEYLSSLEKLTGIDALILKADISQCSDAPMCADKIAEQI